MAQSSAVQKLRETETEIAVLQVQYSNLNEKVEDVKTGLRDLHNNIDTHMSELKTSMNNIKDDFNKSLTTFKDDNKKQHDAVEKKISTLEKWRWMMMGAGVLAGALGWPVISKLLHM